jgi:hypothetical protein
VLSLASRAMEKRRKKEKEKKEKGVGKSLGRKVQRRIGRRSEEKGKGEMRESAQIAPKARRFKNFNAICKKIIFG